MKKKGLLISTIVLVVVLVASLTTATYAWFSATASVKIADMAIKTEATEGLVIGAKTGSSSYGNGSLTWNGTGYWANPTNNGLGSSVEFSIDETVYSGTVTADSTTYGMTVKKAVTPNQDSGTLYISGAEYVKANSMSDDSTKVNSGSVAKAEKNIDYIDLELGLAASAEDSVTQSWGTITISPTLDGGQLGMAGAIHMTLIVNGTTKFANKDIYWMEDGATLAASGASTGNNNNFGELNTSDGTLTIVFPVFNESGAAGTYMDIQETTIYTIRIIVWFEGEDSSCTNDNTGLGDSTMSIKFDYAGKTQNTQMYEFSNYRKTAKA